MSGVTSAPTNEALVAELEARDAHLNDTPGRNANPDFITDEDRLGEGHSRATREAARFQGFASHLVKNSPPVDPSQAEVKVPRLVLTASGWDTVTHTLTGAITLKVERASKFRGRPDYSAPSQKLASFTQGDGIAWTDFRDDDMPGLLIAWAESVEPEAMTARHASQALAVAMCARAGLKVKLGQVGF